ncbi:Bifunctional protein PyrR [subsurface metagenome]
MQKHLLDKKDIERIIARISSEILERNKDTSRLIVIGIKKRGDFLGERIAHKLEFMDGQKVETAAIDITFYRDDVQLKAYKYLLKEEINFEITDKNVVLVDDVIFTGRTIRAAVDALIDSGRPKSIQLVVLIDRSGRELPIQPDYFGKKIHADFKSKVLVHIKEIDGEDEVLIS